MKKFKPTADASEKAVSTQECTGLTPAAIQDEAQAEALDEILETHIHKK